VKALGRIVPTIVAAALAGGLAAAAPAPPRSRPVASAQVAADLRAYGEWLARLDAIERPLRTELAGLNARWEEANRRADPRAAAAQFRPVVARMAALIDETNARLRALSAPDLASLRLIEGVRPADVVGQMIRINSGLRDVVDAYHPLMDSLASADPRAADAAGRRMMEGIALVFEGQIVFTRASLAATPRAEARWDMINVQLLYFRAVARAHATWPHARARTPDPGLAADLRAIAAELETTATEGAAKLEGLIARTEAAGAEAGRARDSGRALALRRSAAMLRVDRRIFPLARRLAAILRDGAAALDGRPITPANFADLSRPLQQIHEAIEAILSDESAAGATTG
jgi:hypothetical protein